jgi:hypothetical protein
VYVDDRLIWENLNQYGEPPFCIAFPGVLDVEEQTTDKYYEALGDSILHALRTQDGTTLFDEVNYVASYLKTMAYDDLKPAVQIMPDKDGNEQKPPESVPGSAQMVSVKSQVLPWPRGQLTTAMTTYMAKISEAEQRGTFATLEQGIIDLPQSGVAIAKKVALQNESLLPRLNCIASLYQQTALMEIRQFIALGNSAEIGEPDMRSTIPPLSLTAITLLIQVLYFFARELLERHP